MCGIYGAFSTDAERPTRADVLERMAHVLAHRGPDGGGGSHLAGPFGMGMGRLTIIDLASGDQPTSAEDAGVADRCHFATPTDEPVDLVVFA